MSETRVIEMKPPARRNMSSIVVEIREELRDFLSTRVEIARAEIRDVLSSVKIGIPLAVVALAFIATALLLAAGAAVAIVASALAPGQYACILAFVIVAVLWAIIGAVVGLFAYNSFRSRSISMRHTVEVLKADKAAIETAVRGQS